MSNLSERANMEEIGLETVSISYGAADIAFGTVWEAIFRINPNVTQHGGHSEFSELKTRRR